MRVLSIIENTILAITLVIMLGLAFANVIVRKFTTLQLAFTEELTCALFILLSLVGTAALARENGHIGLTIFTDMIPSKFKKYATLFSAIIACAFCACLFYFGVRMVMSEVASGVKTAALKWPEWIFGSFVPVGAFFSFLEFMNYCILSFHPLKENDTESEEDK